MTVDLWVNVAMQSLGINILDPCKFKYHHHQDYHLGFWTG